MSSLFEINIHPSSDLGLWGDDASRWPLLLVPLMLGMYQARAGGFPRADVMLPGVGWTMGGTSWLISLGSGDSFVRLFVVLSGPRIALLSNLRWRRSRGLLRLTLRVTLKLERLR